MNKFIFIYFLVAFSVTAAGSEKYALLIGVTTYQNPHVNRGPLKYPEADATAVAEMLRSSGYEVKMLIGKRATQTAIEDELTKLEQQGTEDGVVFIGLFGRGVPHRQDSFFVPFDAQVKALTDSSGTRVIDRDGKPVLEPDPESLVSVRAILDSIERSRAGCRFVLADIGREKPFFGRNWKDLWNGPGVSGFPEQTAVVLSCSHQEMSIESDTWGHSAFVKAFLSEAMALRQVGPVYAQTLADRTHSAVNKSVEELTEGKGHQTVQYTASGVIDLQLTKPSSSASEKK